LDEARRTGAFFVLCRFALIRDDDLDFTAVALGDVRLDIDFERLAEKAGPISKVAATRSERSRRNVIFLSFSITEQSAEEVLISRG